MPKWLIVQLGRHTNEGKGRPRDALCGKLACCLSVCLLTLEVPKDSSSAR
jgi:hypothetical protein